MKIGIDDLDNKSINLYSEIISNEITSYYHDYYNLNINNLCKNSNTLCFSNNYRNKTISSLISIIEKLIILLILSVLIQISKQSTSPSTIEATKFQAIWYIKMEINSTISNVNDISRYTHYLALVNFRSNDELSQFKSTDIPNQDYLVFLKRNDLNSISTDLKDNKSSYTYYKSFFPTINYTSDKGIALITHITQDNCVLYFKITYFSLLSKAINRYNYLIAYTTNTYYNLLGQSMTNFNTELNNIYFTANVTDTNASFCTVSYSILRCKYSLDTSFVIKLNNNLNNFIFDVNTIANSNSFVNTNDNLIDSSVNPLCDDIISKSNICSGEPNGNIEYRNYFLIPEGFSSNCIKFYSYNRELMAYCGYNYLPSVSSLNLRLVKPNYFSLTNCIRSGRAYYLLVTEITDY